MCNNYLVKWKFSLKKLRLVVRNYKLVKTRLYINLLSTPTPPQPPPVQNGIYISFKISGAREREFCPPIKRKRMIAIC